MADSVILFFGLALLAIVGAFVVGWRFSEGRKAPGKDSSSIDVARLEERERLIGSEIGKLETQVGTLTSEIEQQHAQLMSVKQKVAGGEERIAGLERELAREREISLGAQRKLDTTLTEAGSEKDRLQAISSEEARKRAEAERSESELRGQLERAGKHITDRDETIQILRNQLEEVRRAAANKDSDLAASAERQLALSQTISERDEQLKGLNQQLKTEFQNIANQILGATADDLSTKSFDSLAVILNPLKTQISEFREKVETVHNEDIGQQAAMLTEIRSVAAAGLSIGTQAENLTKALKGDSQLRGQWGEVRLERILEQAGLERGREYVVQGGDLSLKGEDGGSLRPDVIVLLPENRHLIVDSKLSLVHYLEYQSGDNDDARAAALKKLIGSVRGHADSLAAKDYQSSDGLNSHELVLMFVPIEGIAAVVLNHDPELYAYCWKRRVVMASPSTLFMTMQTVASIWRHERQNENAQIIALQAGQLYDKLAGFVSDLNDVSTKIQAAADAHGDAMRKLATGRGNALSRAQKLKALGVTSKKDFPAVVLGGEKLIVDADDDEVSVSSVESTTPKLLEDEQRDSTVLDPDLESWALALNARVPPRP